MTAFVDTNILARHFTGDPPDQAMAASAYLLLEPALLVTDVVLAETAYVLSSFYEATRAQVATALRSLIGERTVVVVDPNVLLRTLELFEQSTLHFVDAYLVASAETTGVGRVASFDRAIDRIPTVERIEPAW